MALSQPFCSRAYFYSRLTPKRNLTYPELVSLPCLDTGRYRQRHPVTERHPLFTARPRRRDMGKVTGMIMNTGSIASAWSIESTNSADAWRTPLTVRIASGWSIISTKFMKSANMSVGTVETDCQSDGLQSGCGC